MNLDHGSAAGTTGGRVRSAGESTEAGAVETHCAEDARNGQDVPVIRFEDLVERCMGNLELAMQLLDKSPSYLVDDVTMLQQCDEHEDPHEVVRLAHRLKGAAANVGAYELSDVFARIEQHGRTGNPAATPEALEEVETEWSRFVAGVADLCGHK